MRCLQLFQALDVFRRVLAAILDCPPQYCQLTMCGSMHARPLVPRGSRLLELSVAHADDRLYRNTSHSRSHGPIATDPDDRLQLHTCMSICPTHIR